MEVKKKKATGVLAEMIENMNIEELAETRKQMMEDINNPINAWLDKESRAYRNMREKCGVVDPVYLNEIEDAAYYDTSLFDDLVDACVEMIFILKNRDLI